MYSNRRNYFVVLIEDLPQDAVETDLIKFMQPLGRVNAITIHRHHSGNHQTRTTGVSATAEFQQREHAEAVLAYFESNLVWGKKLRVQMMNPGGNNTVPTPQQMSSISPKPMRSAQVHISYLTKQLTMIVSEQMIYELFSNFGKVLEVSLKKKCVDTEMCIQNGYGFVHFPLTSEGIDGALRAVESLHQVTINQVSYDCSVSNQLRQVLFNTGRLLKKPNTPPPASLMGGQNGHGMAGPPQMNRSASDSLYRSMEANNGNQPLQRDYQPQQLQQQGMVRQVSQSWGEENRALPPPLSNSRSMSANTGSNNISPTGHPLFHTMGNTSHSDNGNSSGLQYRGQDFKPKSFAVPATLDTRSTSQSNLFSYSSNTPTNGNSRHNSAYFSMEQEMEASLNHQEAGNNLSSNASNNMFTSLHNFGSRDRVDSTWATSSVDTSSKSLSASSSGSMASLLPSNSHSHSGIDFGITTHHYNQDLSSNNNSKVYTPRGSNPAAVHALTSSNYPSNQSLSRTTSSWNQPQLQQPMSMSAYNLLAPPVPQQQPQPPIAPGLNTPPSETPRSLTNTLSTSPSSPQGLPDVLGSQPLSPMQNNGQQQEQSRSLSSSSPPASGLLTLSLGSQQQQHSPQHPPSFPFFTSNANNLHNFNAGSSQLDSALRMKSDFFFTGEQSHHDHSNNHNQYPSGSGIFDSQLFQQMPLQQQQKQQQPQSSQQLQTQSHSSQWH